MLKIEKADTEINAVLKGYIGTAGIVKAAIFLTNPSNKLISEYCIGYEKDLINQFFDQYELLMQVVITGKTIQIISASDIEKDFLHKAKVKSALIIPLISSLNTNLGVLFLGLATPQVTGTQQLTIINILIKHITQAVEIYGVR